MSKIELPEKIFGVESHVLMAFSLPILVGCMWLATLVTVVAPKISEIQDLNGEASKLSTEAKKLTEKRNYLASIDQEMIIKNKDALDSALLPSKDAYILVNVIRRVATAHGFDVDSFQITPGEVFTESNEKEKQKQNMGLDRIPVNVVLVGSEAKFMELLAGIEKSLPILSIDGMERKSNREISEVRMTVSSYFVPDKLDVKSVTASLAELTLTKTESDLINTISQFGKSQDGNSLENSLTIQKSFTKFERGNPFSL